MITKWTCMNKSLVFLIVLYEHWGILEIQRLHYTCLCQQYDRKGIWKNLRFKGGPQKWFWQHVFSPRPGELWVRHRSLSSKQGTPLYESLQLDALFFCMQRCSGSGVMSTDVAKAMATRVWIRNCIFAAWNTEKSLESHAMDRKACCGLNSQSFPSITPSTLRVLSTGTLQPNNLIAIFPRNATHSTTEKTANSPS